MPTKILFIKAYGEEFCQAIDIPLGILYLSAFIKKMLPGQVEIKFVDMRLVKDHNASLVEIIQQYKPAIIGITLMNFEKPFLDNKLSLIKENATDAVIVIGGPYATCNHEEILQYKEVNCVVMGEGEITFHRLVDAFRKGENFNCIDGIAFRDGSRIQINPSPPYIEDLDALPFPDYDLIDFQRYWEFHPQMNFILADRHYAPVISSRACPFQCIFCHNIFGKKLRKRSSENFYNELRMLYEKYGVREFHIVDDAFNLDRERMHRILRLIIDNGLKIRIAFPNALRGDALTEEDILLLKEAGVYMITFAIETASQRLQKLIKKNLDVQKVMHNINFASRSGLIAGAYCMIGFPTETMEEMKLTISTVVHSELNLVNFFAVTPFKGTELYEMAKKLYPEIDMDNSGKYFTRKTFYRNLSGIDIVNIQIHGMMRFYTPLRIFRLFKKTPLKLYLIRRLLLSVMRHIRI